MATIPDVVIQGGLVARHRKLPSHSANQMVSLFDGADPKSSWGSDKRELPQMCRLGELRAVLHAVEQLSINIYSSIGSWMSERSEKHKVRALQFPIVHQARTRLDLNPKTMRQRLTLLTEITSELSESSLVLF